MARIKITIPEHKIFSAIIPVRITDINYGNHLGNDALVSIIHEARMQWLASNNKTELQIDGVALIMADLAVEYKGEAFYGDVLNINIAVDEIQKVSFELYYEISTIRNERSILIAKAKTGMVCFDYQARKVTSIPNAFVYFLNS